MGEECPSCAKKYERLGTHWYYNPNCRPNFSNKQKQILKGLLMSDGTISKTKANSWFVAEMCNKEYLKYLSKIFPVLSTDVDLKHTSEESAERSRKYGLNPDAEKENYKDTYVWRTKSHPYINNLEQWYSSGKKVWPTSLKLTPRVLKHWYIGDGHFRKTKNYYAIKIAMDNERKNKRKIENYFKKQNLSKPDYWKVWNINNKQKCTARWNKDSSKKLFDYMGEAPPGFEYKWPS